MKKRLLDLRSHQPILDIVSYGRKGPASLTREQRELLVRTVRRAPEVVVKVSGGARTLAGVEQSFRYYGRKGKLDLESDTGERWSGKGFERDLVRDWNLDLEAHSRQSARAIRSGRRPSRLVYNVVFSMVPGTPPIKVLQSVQKFAREEFGFKHRYAMVLHVDEPHPHVHLVVKAQGEDGERLYIRKPTLRRWREQFAANLRELGVSANATERAVRGVPGTRKRDEIYRAAERGDSTFMRDRMKRVTRVGLVPIRDEGKTTILSTRERIVDGWRRVGQGLRTMGYPYLAEEIDRFIDELPPVLTERELTRQRVQQAIRTQQTPLPSR